ncbi:MAG: hypothetical protein CMJ65_03180 [Planctomycetaceae bacterium]|nr:hypothetical protein [Planctomycetaceae bacterium]
MKLPALLAVAAAAIVMVGCQREVPRPSGPVPDALNFRLKSIDGEQVDMSRYHGRVVVVVNVANY